MIDSVQLVLFAVIIVLTILLVVLGVQVFYILKEVRRTLEKTNKVLDDTGHITENISKPISALSTVAMTFRAGSVVTVAKIIKSLISRDEDDDTHKKSHKA